MTSGSGMAGMAPDFTIITATLNAARTITTCLKSIQEQTVPVQHLIMDGGSQDNTLQLIESFNSSSRHVISEPDNGVYHAMNKGIDRASGEIIGFLNADDFYADAAVLKRVARVFVDKSVDSCYGDLQYVAQNNINQVVRHWHSGCFGVKRFYHGWMPPHPTFFVRRRVYEQWGGFKPGLGSAADYELMLRFLVKHQIRTVYIPEVLVKMRTGGLSNASLKNRLKANRMDRKAWAINGLRPLPLTLAMKPLRKIPQWWQRPEEKRRL